MNKITILFMIHIQFIAPLWSNAQADTGRSSAMSTLDSGKFVSSSIIDTESILSEYSNPYKLITEFAATIDMSASNLNILLTGGEIHIQVALQTNKEDFFQKRDINYIIFINEDGLLKDVGYQKALQSGINAILGTKEAETSVYVYLRYINQLKLLETKETATQTIEDLISHSKNQESISLQDSRKDLEKLLQILPENKRPNKIFWLFSKSIADSANDIDDLYSIIAGLSSTTTEITYCGYSEKFRAAIVNPIVRKFGGESYFFTSNEELKEILKKNFLFYTLPAVSNLRIEILGLEELKPVIRQWDYYGYEEIIEERHNRNIFVRSIGPNESRIYLEPFSIPPVEGDMTHQVCLIVISYYDHYTDSYKYLSKKIEIYYTADSNEIAQSDNFNVSRNVEILRTYTLINSLPDYLRRKNYSTPLILLWEQIERLEYLNRIEHDQMIEDDIRMLQKYKELIYLNKDNPMKGLKALMDLSIY
jgi:hypothetical protein